MDMNHTLLSDMRSGKWSLSVPLAPLPFHLSVPVHSVQVKPPTLLVIKFHIMELSMNARLQMDGVPRRDTSLTHRFGAKHGT
mmetsp:Transcript_21152/g.45829  ORF Transcript_21152/g.45829 Transcript_21152/m.45829 type:complete len:82 (-) Transcript_21152:40-285(-)